MSNVYAFCKIEDGKIILKGNDESVIQLPLTPEYLEMFGAVQHETGANIVEGVSKTGIDNKHILHVSEGRSLDKARCKTPTTPENCADKVTWDDAAIKCLIQLYAEHEKTFKNPKIRNDEVWRIISENLVQNGFNYTFKQSQNKFKHIKKLYMKCKDAMGAKGSGASPVHFQYLQEMDEIFSTQPNVVPVATASSSMGSQLNADVVQKSFTHGIKRQSDTPEVKKPKKQSTLILEMLKKNEENRDKRHQELLLAQKDATEAYERTMNKLIDKL